MTEPTDPTDDAAQSPEGDATPPPWGDDFDPARAWHTITTLRDREKELSKVPRLTSEQSRQLSEYQQLVEASKSEAERQQDALDAATRAAESARSEATRYKAAATYGIPAEHFDLLGNGTEDEISARAEKIQALIAATVAPTAPPTTPTPRRPVEQMRPGATPSETQSEDDVAYAALFGTTG